MAFGQDAKRLYAAESSGALGTWDSIRWTRRPRDLQARLCRLVDRSLTRQEWREFIPGRPYHETCE